MRSLSPGPGPVQFYVVASLAASESFSLSFQLAISLDHFKGWKILSTSCTSAPPPPPPKKKKLFLLVGYGITTIPLYSIIIAVCCVINFKANPALLSNCRSVPDKHPLLGKRPCTAFQGVYVAASIQTYGDYIPGKHPWCQNCELCLSTHGCLPRILCIIRYM